MRSPLRTARSRIWQQLFLTWRRVNLWETSTAKSGGIKPSKIINNLTTTEEGFALDARQGKVLSDKIGSTDISSLGSTVTAAVAAVNNKFTNSSSFRAVSSSNSGWANLFTNNEGGSLRLVSPDSTGHMEMDLYNNTTFRLYVGNSSREAIRSPIVAATDGSYATFDGTASENPKYSELSAWTTGSGWYQASDVPSYIYYRYIRNSTLKIIQINLSVYVGENTKTTVFSLGAMSNLLAKLGVSTLNGGVGQWIPLGVREEYSYNCGYCPALYLGASSEYIQVGRLYNLSGTISAWAANEASNRVWQGSFMTTFT